MSEKQYEIIIHSIWRFILSFVASIIILNICISDFINLGSSILIVIVQTVVTLFASFYISNYLSVGKVRIELDKEGFKHYWVKRFILNSEKSVRIRWDLIENYVFNVDRAFDSFVLIISGQQKYRIDRLNLIRINDDFEKLVSEFPRTANEFLSNSSSKVVGQKITQGKTIYEKESFKWTVYLFGLFFLLLVVVKIIDTEGGTPWGSLGIIGSMFFFYAYMIYSNRSKN